MKKLFTLKNILMGIVLIVCDLAVYLFLGVMLMGYDDSYEESKGKYWSLASMNFEQKLNYICLYLWYLINVILICYFLFKILKNIRKTR